MTLRQVPCHAVKSDSANYNAQCEALLIPLDTVQSDIVSFTPATLNAESDTVKRNA